VKKYTLILYALCVAGFASAQHGPLISQYMLNGLPLNPAFAGSRDAASVTGAYRNQWTGLSGAPVTQTISMHAPLKNQALAVGLTAYADQIGVSNLTGVNAAFSYRVKLAKGKLAMGMSGGIQHASNRWSDVITTEENDDRFAVGNDQYMLPDFGAGLYYYSQRGYVSFSVPSILGAKYAGGQRYQVKHSAADYDWFLNSGMIFKLNSDFSLTPSFMLRVKGTSGLQADINVRAAYQRIFEVGISLRGGDALVAMFKVNVNKQFSFGYAFDHSLNEIGRYSNGTHEMILQYDFKYRTSASNPRFF
jgi:type IX secretion system PorP/SprF family membrane protein